MNRHAHLAEFGGAIALVGAWLAQVPWTQVLSLALTAGLVATAVSRELRGWRFKQPPGQDGT
jgi:hypothetical protein